MTTPTNGRIKLEPAIALALALQLLLFGGAFTVTIYRLSELEKKLGTLSTTAETKAMLNEAQLTHTLNFHTTTIKNEKRK